MIYRVEVMADRKGFKSDIEAEKLHNVCVVITLCVMPYSGYIINLESVVSEIQA